MSTPPPSTGPQWAYGPNAVLPVPAITTLQRLAGFAVNQILTAPFLNGLLNNIGDWLVYLNGPRAPYATLEGAANAMAAGDVATIWENDTANTPGNFLAGYRTSGDIYSKIAVTSDVIVVAQFAIAPTIAVYSRSDPGGTALRTLTLANPGFPTAITIYGNIVAVCSAGYVELFTLSTGASLWSYNHGGSILDVQISGVYTVIAGAAGTGTKHARIFNTTTGALLYSIDHGAQLNACAIYGRLVAVAGAPGTTGYNVRGYQLTGTLTSLWGLAAATAGTLLTLRTDGRVLYTTEVGSAYALSWADGSEIANQNILGGAVATSQWMAVDQGGVYVMSTDGTDTELQRLALTTLSYVWQTTIATGGVSGTMVAVATDGARVWSLNTVGGAAARLLTYARGNVAGQWTKIDTSVTTYNRFGWLLQPGVE